MNPFDRITYTEQERELSKDVWHMFANFWNEISPVTPESPEKTLMMRKLQEASYYWEIANTNKCKQQRVSAINKGEANANHT